MRAPTSRRLAVAWSVASLLVVVGGAAQGAPAARPSPFAGTVVSQVISPNGSPVTLSFKKPGRTGQVSLSGLAGEQVTVATSGGTFAGNCDVQVSLRRGGTTLAGPSCGGQSVTLPQVSLPADDTYVVEVDPTPTATGKLKVSVASSGPIQSITPNAKGVKVSVPAGATLNLGTIVGNGVKLSATATGGKGFTGCDSYRIWILKPDSSTLTTGSACAASDAFADAAAAPAAGTYTLRIQNFGATNGSTTLALYSFKDVTKSLSPSASGAALKAKIAAPGQNASASFAGTTGERISVTVGGVKKFAGCDSYAVSLLRPDGSQLAHTSACGTNSAFIDTQTLDQTGTWKVLLDPAGPTVGTATLTIYTVADQTANVTPTAGGATVAATIGTPGENVVVSFSGTAGQVVSAWVKDVTGFGGCDSYGVRLIRPDASVLAATSACGTSDAFTDARTLDQTGTWKVVLDPFGANLGTATMKIYSVTDQTGTITKGGPAVNVATATPGQNAKFTFSGTSGTIVTVNVTGATYNLTCDAYQVRLVRPDGSVLTQGGSCGSTLTLGPATLDASGTWTVLFDPIWVSTGTASMALS
jgi:hypothetical protein